MKLAKIRCVVLTVKWFFFHGQVFQLKFLYQFKSDSTEILQLT